uniref:hypothetical protein n=1 Tax=Bacillus thuringiensis TaxID=1428 RepID=UPI00119F939A
LATSNSAPTQINLPHINPTKSLNKLFTHIAQTLTYTIPLPNIANIAPTNLIYTHPIPTATTFIPPSLTLNPLTQPAANP